MSEPTASSSPRPARQSLRTRAVRQFWLWHRWLGVASGVVMVIISVTGGLLVVHHELEGVLTSGIYRVPVGERRLPLREVVRAAEAAAPAGVHATVLLPDPAPDRSVQVVLRRAADLTRIYYAWVDPYTARVLSIGEDTEFFTRWLVVLHYRLLAGDPGIVVVTLVSLIFVFLTISGVWIQQRALRTLVRWPFRRGRGWRLTALDLHKWLGMTSLLLNLIWAVTGVYLMVPRVWRMGDARVLSVAAPVPAKATEPAIEPLVAAAQQRFPDTELFNVVLPLREKDPLVIGLLQRDAALWAKFPRAAFDRGDGRLLRVQDPAHQSWSEKVAAVMTPLHFGYYGAGWVKWLYFIFGWSAAVLAATGYISWYLRGKPARAPAA